MRGAGNRGRPRREKGATAGAGAGGKAGLGRRTLGPGGGAARRGPKPGRAPPARRCVGGQGRSAEGPWPRRSASNGSEDRAPAAPRASDQAGRAGAGRCGADRRGRASSIGAPRKPEARPEKAAGTKPHSFDDFATKRRRIEGIPKTGGHPINRDLGIRPQTPASCDERRRKVVKTVRNGPDGPRPAAAHPGVQVEWAERATPSAQHPSTRAPSTQHPGHPGVQAAWRRTGRAQHLHARAPGQLGAGRPRCPRPSCYSAASATGGSPPASSASSCVSSSTGTPSATALSYFDPAASPATT